MIHSCKEPADTGTRQGCDEVDGGRSAPLARSPGSPRLQGVRLPRDLSVIGFDDIRFAGHMDPPLTTIAQPMRQIGEGTVRMLVDILAGRTIAPLSVTLPHTLIIRSSTARVRV